MPVCGIDTSILVRLLTGLPEADYQITLKRLMARRSAKPEPIVVANIVIAEAYAVLQHHYRFSKEDSRSALLSVFASGLVEPSRGDAVLEALRARKEPGLTDRLIALDYNSDHATVLTHDRKMASLSGCQRL